MSISREVLAKYIKPGCQVIETGARWGMTAIKAAGLGAGDYLGCETSERHRAIAMEMLGEVLARAKMSWYISKKTSEELLGNIRYEDRSLAPMVVFLDAHSESHSPVMEELELISQWPRKPDVILIDDMRCMTGWNVTVDYIHQHLILMGYKLSVEDGIEPGDILVARL